MNPWWQLPNALLIDWVLESVKTNPKKWTVALNEDWYATWDAAWEVAWSAAWIADRNAALDAALNAARGVAWGVAHAAILALIAYDDCDQYLQMTYDQLLIYATLSERPQAVLLLPLKWIQEHETLVTLT